MAEHAVGSFFSRRILWCIHLCMTIMVIGHPCDPSGHRRIPNLGLRYVNFKIDFTDVPFHDSLLPFGWYYAGSDTMPENPPESPYSCGTKYPVWLSGTLPTDNQPVNSSACEKGFLDTCQERYDIQIIRCTENGGEYHLYLLGPTLTPDSGYCFGVGVQGDIPSYVAPQPTVNYERYQYFHPTVPPTVQSEVRFHCEFEKSTQSLFYQVLWNRNGESWYSTPFTQENTDPKLFIDEELFVKRAFQMGDNISCSVRAYSVEQGPPGKPSNTSDSIFVGITVLTPHLTFSADEKDSAKRSIRLQPTIPVGCIGEPFCKIWLTAFVPKELYTCVGLSFEESNCGTYIESEQKSIEIPITYESDGTYKTHHSYEVHLATGRSKSNLIWQNYKLPPIKVTITASDTETKDFWGKRCRSYNDPHIKTFDGRYYDNHQAGEYIMYRSDKYDTEVQIMYRVCGYRGTKAILCNCAVAVRAGLDAYVINVCNNNNPRLKSISCGDGKGFTLKTRETYKYQIYFSYGTYVETTINGNSITVEIIPSSHDERTTSGLCGYMDGICLNDLNAVVNGKEDIDLNPCKLTNINYGKQFSRQPIEFITKWKVTDLKRNLFKDQFDWNNIQALEFKVCVCEANPGGVGGTTGYIPCLSSTVASCHTGKTINEHACTSSSNRRRRSVQMSPIIPEVFTGASVSHVLMNRNKRESFNWTQDMAKQYCEDFMMQSQVYSLCNEVPNANPHESIDTCIMDVLLTGDTEWADITMEDMQSTCLSELARNTTLRESTVDGQKSIAEMIEEVACINNCSRAGRCLRGECMCNEGLGGSDCSIDLSRGPTIAGLLDEGLCDEQELECDYAYVFGHIFADSANLKCRLDEFSILENGTRLSETTYYVHGEFETFIEVMCPIQNTRKRRSVGGSTSDTFVIGYTISVSNDGIVYEEGKDLFIYDSECQLLQNISNQMHFKLKDGYCFIDNKCVAEGSRSPIDECLICDITGQLRSWSRAVGFKECQLEDSHPQEEKESNYLWVIGVVVGFVAAVAVVVVVKVFVLKRGKKISDSTMFSSPAATDSLRNQ